MALQHGFDSSWGGTVSVSCDGGEMYWSRTWTTLGERCSPPPQDRMRWTRWQRRFWQVFLARCPRRLPEREGEQPKKRQRRGCTLKTCDKDAEGMGNDEDEDGGP